MTVDYEYQVGYIITRDPKIKILVCIQNEQ